MDMKRIIILSLATFTVLSHVQAQKTIASRKPLTSNEHLTPSAVPDSLSALIAMGDSCMADYNTYAAMDYYQRAYRQNATAEVRQKLANCFFTRCDYRQCVGLLSGLSVNELSHDALRQLFFSYSSLKDERELMHWGPQLLQHYPMDAEVLARLCNVLCDHDKTAEAVAIAYRYYQCDSTNLLVNRTLANSLYLNRQYQSAIDQYQRLMAVGDTTFLGLYSVGMAYEYIGNKQQSYDYLSLAAQRNPKSPGCCYRLGAVCVDMKRYDEGLNFLYKATFLLEPDKTVMKIIADYKGKAYYAQSNYHQAIEAWKQAREYDGESLAFIYNIANSYAALNQQLCTKLPEYSSLPVQPELQQAISYYELLIEMGTSNGHEQTEELQQMIQTAAEYIEQHPISPTTK